MSGEIKTVASSLPGLAPAKAYVKGASCGPGKHAYEAVPGRRYERCPRCGSTRTVKSAAPGVAEPKVRLVKGPKLPKGAYFVDGHLVNGAACPKCALVLADRRGAPA